MRTRGTSVCDDVLLGE